MDQGNVRACGTIVTTPVGVRGPSLHQGFQWRAGAFSFQELLALSATEYELLKYLVINHGIVLSKSKILDEVWGYDFVGQDNIVEVYISSLREKLGDTQRRLIRTIRGAGYRVDLP